MDDVETSMMTRLDKRWFASLALDFSLQRERTTLVGKRHTGPLVVQKMLYPEGDKVCHGIIIHPPGGVAGGDQLLLQSSLKQGAQALLTTPGAGKWYKANGQAASQQLKFDLEPGASLEWLPQENILFDGSSVGFSAEIVLQGDAVFCGWEILCFGRQARGEAWSEGELQQGLSIRRDQRLIWNERMFLHPQSRVLKSVAGLRGFPVSASLVVAAGTVPADVLEACRMIEADQESQYGVTALPEIFSARYIGSSSEAAKQYFERLWQLLRPWYAGRAAVRPRIWNT
ncbi:urease accessory protein UreD [Methylobacillus gramineus]|uniref:urease accessory protein UreD n=1 Tax=Methylobacillus gramineus TaxID=755169 RepID=UPI001CFFAB76|nr:urease accessory protein UreD [Methylobacillus gramineus]MCB5184620.1 urease accessory protein UreD [Methylobacillus gramineus]